MKIYNPTIRGNVITEVSFLQFLEILKAKSEEHYSLNIKMGNDYHMGDSPEELFEKIYSGLAGIPQEKVTMAQVLKAATNATLLPEEEPMEVDNGQAQSKTKSEREEIGRKHLELSKKVKLAMEEVGKAKANDYHLKTEKTKFGPEEFEKFLEECAEEMTSEYAEGDKIKRKTELEARMELRNLLSDPMMTRQTEVMVLKFLEEETDSYASACSEADCQIHYQTDDYNMADPDKNTKNVLEDGIFLVPKSRT